MMRGFLIVLSVLCGIIGILFWLPICLVAVVFAVWAMLCNPAPVLSLTVPRASAKLSQHERDLEYMAKHEKAQEVQVLRQRIADLESQAAAKEEI